MFSEIENNSEGKNEEKWLVLRFINGKATIIFQKIVAFYGRQKMVESTKH